MSTIGSGNTTTGLTQPLAGSSQVTLVAPVVISSPQTTFDLNHAQLATADAVCPFRLRNPDPCVPGVKVQSPPFVVADAGRKGDQASCHTSK